MARNPTRFIVSHYSEHISNGLNELQVIGVVFCRTNARLGSSFAHICFSSYHETSFLS